MPEVWLLGDAHHRTALLSEEMSQVRDSDGSEMMNLRRFFRMLEWHLTVGLLGFLLEGYEAWASIIQGIRGKIILLLSHYHQTKP